MTPDILSCYDEYLAGFSGKVFGNASEDAALHDDYLLEPPT